MYEGYFEIPHSILGYTGRIYVDILKNKVAKVALIYTCPIVSKKVVETGVTQKSLLITDTIVLRMDEASSEQPKTSKITGDITIKGYGIGRFYLVKSTYNFETIPNYECIIL